MLMPAAQDHRGADRDQRRRAGRSLPLVLTPARVRPQALVDGLLLELQGRRRDEPTSLVSDNVDRVEVGEVAGGIVSVAVRPSAEIAAVSTRLVAQSCWPLTSAFTSTKLAFRRSERPAAVSDDEGGRFTSTVLVPWGTGVITQKPSLPTSAQPLSWASTRDSSVTDAGPLPAKSRLCPGG